MQLLRTTVGKNLDQMRKDLRLDMGAVTGTMAIIETVDGSVTTGTGSGTVITGTGCTITESGFGDVTTGPGDPSVATGPGDVLGDMRTINE